MRPPTTQETTMDVMTITGENFTDQETPETVAAAYYRWRTKAGYTFTNPAQ